MNGEEGLKGCCHAQSIIVDRFGPKSEFVWYPYSAGKAKTLQRMMRFIWGTSLGRFFS